MKNVRFSVGCWRNGSMTAVVGSGSSSMCDSWIAWNPRVDDPSNISPSVNTDSAQVADPNLDELDSVVADVAQDLVVTVEHASSLHVGGCGRTGRRRKQATATDHSTVGGHRFPAVTRLFRPGNAGLGRRDHTVGLALPPWADGPGRGCPGRRRPGWLRRSSRTGAASGWVCRRPVWGRWPVSAAGWRRTAWTRWRPTWWPVCWSAPAFQATGAWSCSSLSTSS